MRPSESLSIAELVVYPPILIANIFVLARHGLSRQSGWIFLTIFCTIRIIGAGFGVAYARTGSVTDLIWSSILGSVGISALLMSTAGLLKRVIDESMPRVPVDQKPKTKFEKVLLYTPIVGLLTSYNVFYASRATAASRRSRLIQLTHIPSVVALIICIVGGINLTSPDISDQKQGRSMLRAGIVIFLVIYAILCVLAAYAATKFSEYPSSERRITVVVIVALVLVAPRLIWSCIAYFARTRTFNIVNGSFVVRGFMLTFEEFIIIVMYTVVGLLVPSVYKRQYESQDAIADSHDKRGDQGVEAGTGAALKNLAPDPVKDQ